MSETEDNRPETTAPEGTAAGGGTEVEVTRSVTVDEPVADVWDLVADEEQRALWLDDDDASTRQTRLDRIDPQQGLTWTWWHPGDEGSATQVDISLVEIEPARTRVVVVERPVSPGTTTMSTAATSTSAADPWGYRLLGLELLLMAAIKCVR